jgi:hypothetical protein
VRYAKGLGPHDNQAKIRTKDSAVTSSATQKAARALAHNLRSPRVNLPYWVRRHTAILHSQNQYNIHAASKCGARIA